MLSKIIISAIIMVGTFYMVKFRHIIVDMTGELPTMSKWFGSTQNGIVIIAILIFFLTFLYLTGNLDSITPSALKSFI